MTLSSKPCLILFGGAGREGIIHRLIDHGIEIKKIVVPKKQQTKLKQSIQSLKKIPVVIEKVGKEDLLIALDLEDSAFLISIGFPYIIPREAFNRYEIALNVHPTLLPKYRGPTTGAFIIKNNEPITGSTVHLLEEEVDKGPIVAQSEVSLTPFDTIRSMQRKVYGKEANLVIEAITKLENGFIPIPQDEDLASSYNKVLKPEDSLIDSKKPLEKLIDDIRACDPIDFPAYFFYNGQKIFIKVWRSEKANDEEDML